MLHAACVMSAARRNEPIDVFIQISNMFSRVRCQLVHRSFRDLLYYVEVFSSAKVAGEVEAVFSQPRNMVVDGEARIAGQSSLRVVFSD